MSPVNPDRSKDSIILFYSELDDGLKEHTRDYNNS